MVNATKEIYAQYAAKRIEGGFNQYNSWWLVADRLIGKQVLDVGCSDGLYLKDFAPGSVGIEQLPELADAARSKGYDVNEGDVEASLAQLPDDSFEGILFSHTMEHVQRPIDCLRHIARILQPGGVLVLGLPTERNIFRGLLKMDYYQGTHIYSFSARNAQVLLEFVGLKPEPAVIYHLPKTKGNAGIRIHRTFNRLPIPRKEFLSLAYWMVATKS